MPDEKESTRTPTSAEEWVRLWRLCQLASQSTSPKIRKMALRAIEAGADDIPIELVSVGGER